MFSWIWDYFFGTSMNANEENQEGEYKLFKYPSLDKCNTKFIQFDDNCNEKLYKKLTGDITNIEYLIIKLNEKKKYLPSAPNDLVHVYDHVSNEDQRMKKVFAVILNSKKMKLLEIKRKNYDTQIMLCEQMVSFLKSAVENKQNWVFDYKAFYQEKSVYIYETPENVSLCKNKIKRLSSKYYYLRKHVSNDIRKVSPEDLKKLIKEFAQNVDYISETKLDDLYDSYVKENDRYIQQYNEAIILISNIQNEQGFAIIDNICNMLYDDTKLRINSYKNVVFWVAYRYLFKVIQERLNSLYYENYSRFTINCQKIQNKLISKEDGKMFLPYFVGKKVSEVVEKNHFMKEAVDYFKMIDFCYCPLDVYNYVMQASTAISKAIVENKIRRKKYNGDPDVEIVFDENETEFFAFDIVITYYIYALSYAMPLTAHAFKCFMNEKNCRTRFESSNELCNFIMTINYIEDYKDQ